MVRLTGSCKCPYHRDLLAANCGCWEQVISGAFKCVKCGVVIQYVSNEFSRKTASACARRHADPGSVCPEARPHKVPRQSCGCAPLTMLGAVLQRDVQMAPGFSGAHHAAPPRVVSVSSTTLAEPPLISPPSAVCRAAGRAPVSGAVLARPSCLLLPRLASPPLT
jgi:hypothetical protein